MKTKLYRILMLAAMLLSLAAPATIAQAKADVSSPQGFLNPDGSLKLDDSFSGSLNLSGYRVEMDPNRGPLFHPAENAQANLNNIVYAVAVSGSNVYVGGDFTDAYGIAAADYIVKWNGSAWSALGDNGAGNGSLNGGVWAIAISGSNVYVGGHFYHVNNHGSVLPGADYIAKWNGANWSSLGDNGASNGSLNSDVQSIAIDSANNVYAGGYFYDVNNHGAYIGAADYIAKWDGANWSALGGTPLNAPVTVVAANGLTVYAGGNFTNAGGVAAADYIALWDGATWSALGSNGAGDGSLTVSGYPYIWVYAIAFVDSDVYVGGNFLHVNNNGTVLNDAECIARWDGVSNWSAVGSSGISGGALNSTVYAISTVNTSVYVGGYFSSVYNNGVNTGAAYIAKWDDLTGNWSAMGNTTAPASLNGYVYTIAPDATGVYAGGNFSTVNDHGLWADADHVAYWSGTNWLSLSPSITKNPAAIDFGGQLAGTTSAAHTVTLTNLGHASLTLGTLTTTANFSISSNLCNGQTLATAAACTFKVSFSPPTTGLKTGSVSIPSNAPLSPNSLALSGAGVKQVIIKSAATLDGWVLESGENTNVGGTMNSAAQTFNLGDDATRKQYRGILSFATGPALPDTAVITGVTLKVRQQAIVGGGNPVSIFQGFMADIKVGPFGTSALQTSDFQTAAIISYGPFALAPVSGWYNINLASSKVYINKLAAGSGLTQIRLRFKLDDNNNAIANYLSLYSGNAPAASQPQLVIQYYP